MREANFSFPNANKASVGITTALYDRRALDCTSTLPLINSLNNLAYLTTSSGRIRDILTVDGGVERLVCILKEGRNKDLMEMWKWNLAFKCIVEIGVRGSEKVRTRVVEADMVPVIATVLDNYFRAMEKLKECADAESRRRGTSRSVTKSARKQARPPPINIPDAREGGEDETVDATPTGPVPSSPPARAIFSRDSSSAQPTPVSTSGTSPLQPVRDIDRLPSMVPLLNVDLSSRPQSPTTPHAPVSRAGGAGQRRPTIRAPVSISEFDSDDNVQVSRLAGAGGDADGGSDVVMQDIVDAEVLVEAQGHVVAVRVPDISSNDDDDDAFNMAAHQSTDDGNVNVNVNTATTQAADEVQVPLPPVQITPMIHVGNSTPTPRRTGYNTLNVPPNRTLPPAISAAIPRDEDVLMSLQLLAYVSKYCNLRSYFQNAHLVPRLQITRELDSWDPDDPSGTYTPPTQPDLDADWDNEFLQTPESTINIFPLIEKFTTKPSSSSSSRNISPEQKSMQYWAGIVMRNLCRKDDSRGGIRQCAYWKCGKWEEIPRQFAKCRRCRRTKYCSKECQKGAWGSHRFWCVAAEQGGGGGRLGGQ
ncbi:hypothetical protein K470DRAFT_255249 [Piedraia hortae CBS 480.64]|uniref:MYND-type zinc finger protein samB n=1 Tax=Piedraia hortae CBS 480.64 TaxID=1314780 RepID=A0A6A7C6J1_9PEZI|nr:hypothetical protein K470DRAFT_255249 [Piedraia hortae CBS 480.64]